MGGLQQGLMLVGELDENVFEAGSERANFCDGDAVFQELFAEIVEVEMILDERVDGLSENGGAADSRDLAGEAKRAGDLGSGDFDAQSAVRLNVRQLAGRIGRAVSDELAVINVGDVAAALGFVHVVGGDEEGDAVSAHLEEKVPERAARDRIDAGGGLVEKEKLGFMQHGAAEGQTLLPSTGKLRGQAIQVRSEAVECDDFVDAAVELQIFGDGQIVIKTEILRHVADAFAHGFGIGADVQTFDLSGAAAERQKTGEHFDDGSFAAAVGAEEAEYFTFFDAEADVIDGGEITKTPHEMLGGDGGASVILRDGGHGFNSPLSA